MLKKLYVHLLRNPNSHRKEAKRRKPFKKDDDALRLHWPLMPKAGEVALWPRPLAPSTIEVVWRALFCSRSSSSSSYPPWLQAHRSFAFLPTSTSTRRRSTSTASVYTSILACSRGFFVVPTTAASAPPCSPLAASVQPTDAHVLVVPRLVVAIT